jgi:hypothetical protein
VSAKLQTVHVRVNDAGTGEPTPCRVRFTDAEGKYHAPLGRLTEFAKGCAQDVGGNLLLGQEKFAYIDGACEIQLPPGPITVRISKGPEYVPLQETIPLTQGKPALRFEINRWINLREQGWYSGDVFARFLSPHAALLEGAGEDLAVVNLLAAEYEAWDLTPQQNISTPEAENPNSVAGPREYREKQHKHVSNILAFSGQQPALEMPGHMAVVNTLNQHPTLGHLALLNCHRIVFPLKFGGIDEQDDWTLTDWCDQCHRKGGLVIGIKAFKGVLDHHQETLADCLLGKVDALLAMDDLAIDRCSELHQAGLALWSSLLMCGYRLPLVGGSGKASNCDLLGNTRTYARLTHGDPLTYKAWIEAVRAGRTFVTTGPIISLEVDGHGPGNCVDLERPNETVRVRAEARAQSEFETLEVICNGRVIQSVHLEPSKTEAVLEFDVQVAASSWLLARCTGPYCWPRLSRLAAITSPVYVRVGLRPMQPDPIVIAALNRDLDYTLQWSAHKARCDDKHRERFAQIFRSAKEELLKRSVAYEFGQK